MCPGRTRRALAEREELGSNLLRPSQGAVRAWAPLGQFHDIRPTLATSWPGDPQAGCLAAPPGLHWRGGPGECRRIRARTACATWGRPPRYQSLMATNSASLAATSAIGFSEVFRPLRDPSSGLTSRRASYIVLCKMGTSRSRARSAESSFNALSLNPTQQRRGH
jgi:hypothetical protein